MGNKAAKLVKSRLNCYGAEKSSLGSNPSPSSLVKMTFLQIPHLTNIKGFNPHYETRGYKVFLVNKNEVIGYGSLTHWKGFKHPTIGVWVDRKHRRKGYGEKIARHLLKRNKRAKLTIVKTNKPALKLYEKLGFKIIGTKKDVYWMQAGGERCLRCSSGEDFQKAKSLH